MCTCLRVRTRKIETREKAKKKRTRLNTWLHPSTHILLHSRHSTGLEKRWNDRGYREGCRNTCLEYEREKNMKKLVVGMMGNQKVSRKKAVVPLVRVYILHITLKSPPSPQFPATPSSTKMAIKFLLDLSGATTHWTIPFEIKNFRFQLNFWWHFYSYGNEKQRTKILFFTLYN